MPILGIQQRLVEIGQIRMGEKTGERGSPKSLRTWRVTSPHRQYVEQVALAYGGQVSPWRRKPGDPEEYEVVTESDTLNVVVAGSEPSQWYELWSAGGLSRRCDGETCQAHEKTGIVDRPCVCAALDDRECKPTTRLGVHIVEVAGLGQFTLTCKGYHAAAEVFQAARLFAEQTRVGNRVPVRLVLEARTAVKGGLTKRFVTPVIQADLRILELGSAPSASLPQARPLPIATDPALPAPPLAVPAEAVAPDLDWPVWGGKADQLAIEAGLSPSQACDFKQTGVTAGDVLVQGDADTLASWLASRQTEDNEQ